MCSVDNSLVDGLDFLPEIFRRCRGKASDRIDVSRDFEHASADCRKDALYNLDDAVVERVYGACRFRFANASGDQGLDVLRLDLDIDRGPASNGAEHLSERRNSRPVSERESLELRGREVSDGPMRGPLRVPGVDNRIVMNYDNPIASRVHVELNAIRSELDGALKCGDRILGMRLVCSPVRDPLGRIAARTCGQAFLSVVALCSMSAKLMSATGRGQSALTVGGPERLPDEAP